MTSAKKNHTISLALIKSSSYFFDAAAASAASAESGNTLDAAAVEQGFSAYSGSYGLNNTSSYDEALINALAGLAEGEVTDVIEKQKYVKQVIDVICSEGLIVLD
mgnify:CR=1 FL=1